MIIERLPYLSADFHAFWVAPCSRARTLRGGLKASDVHGPPGPGGRFMAERAACSRGRRPAHGVKEQLGIKTYQNYCPRKRDPGKYLLRRCARAPALAHHKLLQSPFAPSVSNHHIRRGYVDPGGLKGGENHLYPRLPRPFKERLTGLRSVKSLVKQWWFGKGHQNNGCWKPRV